MHPREKILGLYSLYQNQGQNIPDWLLQQAKKAKVNLPGAESNQTNQETKKDEQN
jgi:hypothetical protein